SVQRKGINLRDKNIIRLLYGDTQIKGDSPELVEYTGMKNLINDVKDSVKLENGKLLFVGGGKLSRVT
ncbi:BnaAnng35130D, partial [Brassica napus]